jgi:hypothetical protein
MGHSRMTLSTPNAASSRRDSWLAPHQSLDPCQRRLTYGPVRPMDWGDRAFWRPFWRRLLGRG